MLQKLGIKIKPTYKAIVGCETNCHKCEYNSGYAPMGGFCGGNATYNPQEGSTYYCQTRDLKDRNGYCRFFEPYRYTQEKSILKTIIVILAILGIMTFLTK